MVSRNRTTDRVKIGVLARNFAEVAGVAASGCAGQEKSVHRPLYSQSPKRVGSTPVAPGWCR